MHGFAAAQAAWEVAGGLGGGSAHAASTPTARAGMTRSGIVAVVARLSPRFRDWAGALGQVAHSAPLRRAQISFAAMWAGESAFMVGLGVVAFRDGGVAAVGAVTAARMAPAALLAPFLATMADRVRRERVLVWVESCAPRCWDVLR